MTVNACHLRNPRVTADRACVHRQQVWRAILRALDRARQHAGARHATFRGDLEVRAVQPQTHPVGAPVDDPVRVEQHGRVLQQSRLHAGAASQSPARCHGRSEFGWRRKCLGALTGHDQPVAFPESRTREPAEAGLQVGRGGTEHFVGLEPAGNSEVNPRARARGADFEHVPFPGEERPVGLDLLAVKRKHRSSAGDASC